MDNQSVDMREVAWALAIAVAICAPAWMLLARRLWRREPLLRWERRRPVPWRGIDVFVVFGPILVPLLISCGMGVLSPLSKVLFENRPIAVDSDQEVAPPRDDKPSATPQTGAPGRPDVEEEADQEQLQKAHPLLKLLTQRRDPWTILIVVLSAVVVVPIAEEFYFRLVLQGWLEAVERRIRRRRRWLLPLRPGVWPIVVVSILFGAMHARPPAPLGDAERVLGQLTVTLIAYPTFLAAAVFWLWLRSGATAVDFGIVPSRFLSDCATGIVAFLAVAIPIYGLQGLLSTIPGFVPDPITLFFFASTLGFLYGRTHRLVPAIALHMALNGLSLVMVLVL